MRPVQQNRRMRGRGNNNRKGPNPLSRNYESNGPDVKIRGNAQHIAEKYTTLARDAQSSGDRVMAENYLQHAEHYNRIILAAQAQAPVQYQRDDRDDQDDDGVYDDDGNEQQQDRPVQHQQINGSGPQPVIEGTPAEVAYGEEPVSQRQPHQQRRQYDQATAAEENASGNDDEAAAEAGESQEAAEAKPARRAPRGRKPARPREPRTTEENAAPAAAAADTANDLSPASIVAEVKKRRAAVESDV
ncbi:uncharacterized protein DUF4167 [Phyllobacterium myrsinacearum]|uniref:DUF4167 domain-containing protein n=1 Tax=Phyllobacterium myrsinacearum TaxID=28101 RepID=UPI0010E31D9E|nr:DUF4167 domain-containing protein [Phyllobacterium myrsinacearum]RZS81949.1 uncharacterized protein DUF4167 [Phyllobacterium myrsinacearum]